MNLLVYIYIFLYITYVLLGPYFILKLINKKKLNYAKNFEELCQRMLYFSYIAYLYNAYYFYKPNLETFYNAILINSLAIFSFIIKWYNTKNIDPYYYSGVFLHIIVILPIFISYPFYKLEKPENFGNFTRYTLILIIVYFLLENNIYNTGDDLKKLVFN